MTAKDRFEEYCQRNRLIPTTEAQRATKTLMERAWLSAERGWVTRVQAASENLCSCGGGGIDDPHTCQACKLYHSLKIGDNEKVRV
jgi:hypothetical protein